ncbi:hypothetical protein [Streptomyces sp. NBC_01751]|uniref:hypothetical protein n=1 Tax=Streptomyces sp. NBC_01751 TaxID=2975929 RepID=UPI002DDA1305|nr:hypothetical protein [Streptomyces sp. NBC_01751]WSD22383.1 hypothetical protein OHA26_01955 [Streptomyces sp. NBC_01751]
MPLQPTSWSAPTTTAVVVRRAVAPRPRGRLLRRVRHLARPGRRGRDRRTTPLAARRRETALRLGARQIGFAWYDAGRNELRCEAGCVVDDVVHQILAPTDVPDATLRELAAKEGDLWQQPWRHVIVDCLERRAVLGTPIAEHVPDRLVSGCLAFVGDAAHVPTSMTGSGRSMSLEDAEAIADAGASGVPSWRWSGLGL